MSLVIGGKYFLSLDHQSFLLGVFIKPLLIEVVDDGLVVLDLLQSSQVKLDFFHLAVLAKNDVGASSSMVGSLCPSHRDHNGAIGVQSFVPKHNQSLLYWLYTLISVLLNALEFIFYGRPYSLRVSTNIHNVFNFNIISIFI